MAFLSRAGNLLKQATTSNPVLNQAIRCMSTSKLFIGGLPWSTDDNSLRNAFSSYGEVVEARVIQDRETGRSRGFGFVTFQSTEEASAAMSEMDGKEIDGRAVRVNYANDRPSFRGGYGGGGGFGGGGYGGGGGGGYGGSGYGGGGYGGDGGGYGGGGYGGGSRGGNYGVTEGGGDFGNLGGGNAAFGANATGGYAGNTSGGFNFSGANGGSGGSGDINASSDNFSSKEDQYDEKDDGLDDDFKIEDNDEQEPDDFANKRS